MTMSNNIGTHLGYCIYLNKPHYIFNSEIKHEVLNNQVIQNNTDEAVERANQSDNVSKMKELFSTFQEKITKEQYDLISYLWGFDEVKTPEELKSIILEINQNYSPIKYYLSCIKRTKDLIIEKYI